MIVLIGYAASIFLAISLLVTNTLKFRWLNTLGNITFIVYGLFIMAIPVLVANTVLLCINIYQLIKLYNYREQFKLVTITHENNIVQAFLRFYKRDIEQYFPGVKLTETENRVCFVVLRDLAISNLFVAILSENGDAYVEMNYTVPNYRDYKVGKFIFDTKKAYLQNIGIKRIVYTSVLNKKHLEFIKQMGFIKLNTSGIECWAKEL